MPKTILHIGMPRAASTYFQKEVFPRIEDCTFLGVETAHYHPVFQKIMYQDESQFNLEEIKKALDGLCGETTLISNEVFVGQSRYLSGSNRTRTAKRFKALFPEAEVLLVLRNQANLIQSLYAIDVYAGYAGSPEEYVKFTEPSPGYDNTLANYPTLEDGEATGQFFYGDMLHTYREIFDKVHVVLFEDFKENRALFLEKLAGGLQIEMGQIESSKKVNSSLTNVQIRFIRWLNLWKPLLTSTRIGQGIFNIKLRFFEHRLKGKKPFSFSPELKTRLHNHYAQDNQKVLERYPELNESGNFEKHYC